MRGVLLNHLAFQMADAAGDRLGAVGILPDPWALGLVALEWAVALPALVWLHGRSHALLDRDKNASKASGSA